MGYEKVNINDTTAYKHVLKEFFRDASAASSIAMVPFKSGDWRVERKWIPVSTGGMFIGYTNNKIFGRQIGYAEPVQGTVSMLMYKFTEIAVFSPMQRMLQIQYSHDNYDVSAPLNVMMRELYGTFAGGDRGNVLFNVTTSPGGIVGGTCTVYLGDKSEPNSIVLFADNTRCTTHTYMANTIILYGIDALDGNNTLRLKATSSTARRVTHSEFIDGAEVGLW